MRYIKNLYRLLTSRVVIIGVLILIQVVALVRVIFRFSNLFTEFYFAGLTISIIVVLAVINRDINAGYKLALSIPILLVPVVGGLIYIVFYAGITNRRVKKRFEILEKMESESYKQINDGLHNAADLPDSVRKQFTTLHNVGGYPLFDNTSTRYFSLGDEMFPAMKEALSAAKHSIYLEYFIIDFGTMWNEILEILQKKASQGVDVRIIYDDIGTIRRLPWGYKKHLQKMGIECRVYNPLVPVVSSWQNIRDHRKILSVDGEIAFTGGINLSDEYINLRNDLGHWKDSGICLYGKGAVALQTMFLCLWDVLGGVKKQYETIEFGNISVPSDGLVMPYAVTPRDNSSVGRDVYLNAIIHARRTVYLTTPYFVVDGETLTILKLASANGVDIRIMTPHIGDKWYVHMITRSYYKELLDMGIRVFEYTPGFIHAKNMVIDGSLGICGSVNFDYRSFYLQLECGVMMYRSAAVADMQRDFLSMENVCHEITYEDCAKRNKFHKLICSVLRLFAPMM